MSVRRSLATVLFTDIVGSTEHATELGDRDWGELLHRYHMLVAREVTRRGGTVASTTGDGALAVFDGPARAIVAACAIRDRVREIGLEIRAGLAGADPVFRPAHEDALQAIARLRQIDRG